MTVHKRRFRVVVLFCFAVACAGIFLLLLHIAGGLNLAAKYDFEAVVPNAVELVPGANVREAGVDVGTVTGISNRGDSAVIGMALNKKYAPIYKNATVRVATKTLVGENYVDIDPGDADSGPVPANGVLAISQAQDSVQLDQILSTFTPARQAQLRKLLAGLGGGLGNSGPQLNATLDALSSTAQAAAPVAQALSDQSQQLASLVDNLGQVFTALGQDSSGIQTFVTAGTRSAVAVSSRDAALRATLKDLPPTISTVRNVAGHLASVGTAADPVLDNLGAALDDLTPALRALPSAGAATVSALQRLHQVTPVASKLVTALRNTAPTAEALVPKLAAVVDQVRPLIGYLAPYASDAAHLLYELDDAGIAHDSTGLLARLIAVVSAQTVATLTPAEKQLLNVLVGKGAAQIVNFNINNNYPAPNTATAPAPLTTTYPRVTPDSGG
jgi:phospholipid/cholesterol/gamma-HCH transport system substrate-binding protein